MAVRFKKYYPKMCRDIDCKSRKGKYCPSDIPISKQSGNARKCGVWLVELFDDKRKWQSFAFPDVRSRADAEKRLALLISEREHGRFGIIKKKSTPTLAEFSEEYLTIIDSSKINTLLAKKKAIKSLTKYIGHYQLDKLTPFIVERYRIDRQKIDNVQPRSINLDIAVLRHMLNTAIRKGILEKNPCTGVKALKIQQNRDRVLSDSEIQCLMESLEGKDRLMVLMGLLGGLRLNETVKLDWSDIDFENKLITFVQSKTGKVVTIPLSGFLADELLKFKGNKSEGSLFENCVDNKVIVKYSRHFSKLFKELGIQDCTYHCLRHSNATLHREHGTDIITVQGLLAHSNVTQTMRYSHSGLKAKRTAIEAITNHVENLINNQGSTAVRTA